MAMFSLSFLLHVDISAQTAQPPYTGEIVAGTHRWFIISFYDTPPVTAKILGRDKEGIIIREMQDRYVSPRLIDLSTISNIEEIIFGKHGSIGIGFGIPYGTLGINGEYHIMPYLSVNAGIGTTIFSGFGYSLGARGYFREPGPIWRPRASVFYGINGLWIEDLNQFSHPNNAKFSGVTVGLGQSFLWQKHGFDLDLLYILSSALYDEYQEDFSRLKISIGYRYAF